MLGRCGFTRVTCLAHECAQPIEDYPLSAGAHTSLVVAVTARNNARITFAGSTFVFSDAAFRAFVVTPADGRDSHSEPSANRAFCLAVAQWTFQHAGVLRITGLRHRRADGRGADIQLPRRTPSVDSPRSMFPEPEVAPNSLVYRIRDDLVFELDVQVPRGVGCGVCCRVVRSHGEVCSGTRMGLGRGTQPMTCSWNSSCWTRSFEQP